MHSAFGAAELRNFLDADKQQSKETGETTFQPRIDSTKKVARLRAGVVPKWAGSSGAHGGINALEGADYSEPIAPMPVVDFVIDRGHPTGGSGASRATSTAAHAHLHEYGNGAKDDHESSRSSSSAVAQPQPDRRLALASRAPTVTSSVAIAAETAGAAPLRRRIHQAQVLVAAPKARADSEVGTSAAGGAGEGTTLLIGVQGQGQGQGRSPAPAPRDEEEEEEESAGGHDLADSLAARRSRAKVLRQQQQQQQHVRGSSSAEAHDQGRRPHLSTTAAGRESLRDAEAEGALSQPSSSSGSSECDSDAGSSGPEEEEEDNFDYAAKKTENEMRPVFVSKAQRQAMQDQLAAEEEARQQREREQKKERANLSRQMAAEGIRRADAKVLDDGEIDSDSGLPDDTDGLDAQRERDEWEIREITRLQEEVQARTVVALEAAELTRRRHLTDAQVLAERTEAEAEAGAGAGQRRSSSGESSLVPRAPPQSQSQSHTQRKGVFYMDESSVQDGDVRLRDASGLTTTEATRQRALLHGQASAQGRGLGFGRGGKGDALRRY